MKVNILIILVSTILMNLHPYNDSEDNFCDALKVSEENARIVLNNYLDTLDETEDEKCQFEKIKVFFLKQDCIEKVEFGKGYLRTFPPIKQVFITANLNTKISNITINITSNESKLSTEKIIINSSL